MSCLIKFNQVKKTYATKLSKVTVLDKINFDIHYHEMIAIMGSSGSGKSTLMNIMGFLDHPSAGQYFFEEKEVLQFSPYQLARIRNEKIGFVFQSFHLLSRFTVVKNVMLPLFYNGIKNDRAEQRALMVLEKMNMQKFAYYKPNQLSGGQQQRVAIARSLICNPEIILADEPTGALDSKTSAEIVEILSYLNTNERKTIVIVTHDSHISKKCQRIITLKDGHIM